MWRPSALAVLRLMTSSYFDTCSTGRSTTACRCARPTTGHATALPSPAMNARRLMAIPPEREREANTTSAFRAYSMISVAAGASGRPCAGYYAARKSTHPVSHITPDPRRTVLIAIGRRST